MEGREATQWALMFALAVAGGIIRLALKPAKSKWQLFTLLLACGICGVVGADLLIAAWPWWADHHISAAVLCGLTGLSIAKRLVDTADKADIAALAAKLTKP